MANKIVLGYLEWSKVNESAQPDAVYFTIDFGKDIDFDAILTNAIRKTVAKYEDIFKLDEVSADSFTISLNVDEDLASTLSMLGELTPLIVDTSKSAVTYLKISNLISRSFPIISSNDRTLVYTYALKGDEIDFTAKEIADKLANSSKFAEFLKTISPSTFSKSNINLAELNDFILDRENSESVFFKSKDPQHITAVHKFKQALLSLIYYQVFIELLNNLENVSRIEINLSELSAQFDEKISDFKEKINEYLSTRNHSLAQQLVLEIFKFQTELSNMLGASDIRRRLASKFIVKTYDLFQQMGLSGNDAMSLIKK